MQEALVHLINFADDNLEVSQIAHLGLVTFADEAEVVLPLQKMSDGFSIGKLPMGTFTNYAKVFTKLNAVIATDLQRLEDSNLEVKRPVVFFITDGQPVVDGAEQPREAWEPPLRQLHAFSAWRPEGRDVPIAVIALGFEGTNTENLRLVSKWPGVACVAEAGVASPHDLMSSLLKSILISITVSTAEGEFSFTPPPGMTLCL